MTHASNRGTFFLVIGFLFLFTMGLAALMLLGSAIGGGTITVAHQQQAAAVPGWLRDQQASIPDGLTINGHAAKHLGQKLDAWKIYDLLLEGKCVASAEFCSTGGLKKLYLCVDPVTGLIGGVFRIGDEIITGYSSRSADYWDHQVVNEFWEICSDGGE